MAIRLTEDDLRRMGRDPAGKLLSAAPAPPPSASSTRKVAGQMPRGRMNKTEAAYAQRLEYMKHTGKVVWYAFEAMKLRLADKTFYTPDFAVLNADLSLEMHEVKGFWRDDARVKIKVAAEQFPFEFIAVKRAGDGWDFEHIARGDR